MRAKASHMEVRGLLEIVFFAAKLDWNACGRDGAGGRGGAGTSIRGELVEKIASKMKASDFF